MVRELSAGEVQDLRLRGGGGPQCVLGAIFLSGQFQRQLSPLRPKQGINKGQCGCAFVCICKLVQLQLLIFLAPS